MKDLPLAYRERMQALLGKDFAAGKELSNITIKDIAPTIADLMGVHKPAQWEGNSLV